MVQWSFAGHLPFHLLKCEPALFIEAQRIHQQLELVSISIDGRQDFLERQILLLSCPLNLQH